MSSIDWLVIVAYLVSMLVLASFIGRKQRGSSDYFLAGNNMSNSALAMSTIATQCSTNSLLGAPAFVGFTVGGGLLWLQYELAVPFAMAALIWLIVPARQAGVTSIYAILEQRLGVASRRLASGCFLLFRGVATGVTVYGVSLILSSILGVSQVVAVLLLMGITIAYDLLGGLRAVVVSDVIQLILLVAAVLTSLGLLVAETGWSALFDARTQTLVPDWGLQGNDYGLWPMLIGGFFLYMAYYGCDQSQAQRVLAAGSDKGAQRVLLYNGLFRFPLVFSYCLLGLGLAAFARMHPEFLTLLPTTESGHANFNMVFPTYVQHYFTPGFVGLVMVGLIAAAMSSIDSALNSLSAATMEDFIKPFTELDERSELLVSRVITLLWGGLSVAFSFQVEQIAPTVLEAINKIGSMANGPLLALFTIALLLKNVPQSAALAGFACGLCANLALAFFAPQVSWLWWNVSGFLVSCVVAGLWQFATSGPIAVQGYCYPPRARDVAMLVGMGAFILAICVYLQS